MSKVFKDDKKYSRIDSKKYRDTLIKFFITMVESWDQGAGIKNICSTKELDFKEDFGDIDLIVELTNICTRDAFVNDVKNSGLFRDFFYTKNSHCLSCLFDYENGKSYHVDFVMATSEQQYDNFQAYYSNNVVMNFFGQFLQAFNVEVGQDGAKYNYVDKRGNTLKIIFEPNLKKFFLDYFNLTPWSEIISSMEALIKYLTSVPFFPGTEKYLKVHCSDKKRAIKRHGISNDIYTVLDNEKFIGHPDFEFKFFPEHQALINLIISEHETKLEQNRLIRETVENFIVQYQIPEDCRKLVFTNLREILEQSPVFSFKRIKNGNFLNQI